MNPIRKPFHADPRFPFDIVVRATKSPQDEWPDHLHDWYELVYVYRGKGVFFIDRAFYDMEAGDCFLIPGNTIHRAFPDADTPVTSTALFFGPALMPHSPLGEPFSYLRCFELARHNHHYKIKLEGDSLRALEQALAGIEAEIRQASVGYRHAVTLHLAAMLLLLTRQLSSSAHRLAPASVGPGWMNEVLAHIDGHLQDDLSLSALAERVSVSPPHLSRTFKQLTGMTVTEYVNAKRMLLAGELLANTDHGIAAIAAMCGMDSLPHFHRTFKKTTGTTPSAYKRSARY